MSSLSTKNYSGLFLSLYLLKTGKKKFSKESPQSSNFKNFSVKTTHILHFHFTRDYSVFILTSIQFSKPISKNETNYLGRWYKRNKSHHIFRCSKTSVKSCNQRYLYSNGSPTTNSNWYDIITMCNWGQFWGKHNELDILRIEIFLEISVTEDWHKRLFFL